MAPFGFPFGFPFDFAEGFGKTGQLEVVPFPKYAVTGIFPAAC